MGGCDAVVFTGGIGENAPDILASRLNRLAWLGIATDPDLNRRNEPRLHAEGSGAAVWVMRADEERAMSCVSFA